MARRNRIGIGDTVYRADGSSLVVTGLDVNIVECGDIQVDISREKLCLTPPPKNTVA